jgi:hypothetical protein
MKILFTLPVFLFKLPEESREAKGASVIGTNCCAHIPMRDCSVVYLRLDQLALGFNCGFFVL